MASSTRRRRHLATHVGLSLLSTLALAAGVGLSTGVGPATAQDPAKSAPPKTKLGLIVNDAKALPGYTLLSPMNNKNVYLIDNQGRVVHRWKPETNSTHCCYLLPNGNLLRPADLGGREKSFGGGPAPLGRIQEFTWDGQLVWDFTFFNDKQLPHHDICKMPNGNVLMIVWDKKSAEECIAAGRKPELVSKYLLPDSVLEVKPTGPSTGEVVWEWHLWDHLIQDHDPTKANYGVVAEHPELVDINYMAEPPPPPGAPKDAAKTNGADAAKTEPAKKKTDADAFKTIGYVGTAAAQSQRVNPDWTHVNCVDYNAELDQIMLCTPEFGEIWIIDHGTTTEEAAGHTGGRRGKGGDLLYRWGNPAVYRAGGPEDKRLFFQHNAHWIPKGLPGEGHVLIYNNGRGRRDGNYSSVDELVLPLDENGLYTREDGKAWGPAEPVWSYSAPNKSDFYSSFISGAHRLPNGNTMICSGGNGTLFEVTPEKAIVWKYVNPAKGGIGPGGPPPPNQVLNPFLRDALSLTPDQRKELDAFQQEVNATIEKTLDEEQMKKLKQITAGPGGFTMPGQLLSTPTQIQLKLTPEQKKALADLQKSADELLERLLTDDQKKQLKQMREDFARSGPPGGPGRGPGGPPGGPFGGGPPGGTQLFRAYKYAADYPGLAGRSLEPGPTVEEIENANPPTKDAAQK
jgi:DNA-binding MarR family transcriptional regulator